MTPEEATASVGSNKPVTALTATSPREVRLTGRAVGYSISPQLCLETSNGDHTWWRADLCRLALPGEPRSVSGRYPNVGGWKDEWAVVVGGTPVPISFDDRETAARSGRVVTRRVTEWS